MIMKKYSSFLFITFAMIFSTANGQCPAPPGITFTTQAQINSFPATYPTCTVLPNGVNITINGAGITNLTPLSQLTSVSGILEIRNCTGLTNLNGLHNLTTIGNDPLDGFILRNLPVLSSLSALNNLTAITGELTIRDCIALTTLTGLNNLSSDNGTIIIRGNNLLQNLSGLNSLTYIGDALEIVGNTSLTDISALSNVNTIVGGAAGGILIDGNTALTNLTGLGNASTTIGSDLTITNNGNLSLCTVQSICRYLASPPGGAVITITANAAGCATLLEVSTACAVLLPVELISFSGKSNGVFNHLYWETATELNSSHFEIERSMDGIQFIKIGVINSSGNSVSQKHYEFYDKKPVSGIHYYRLKQFDLDGNFEYSKVISIKNNRIDGLISVYPNPVNNELYFTSVKSESNYQILNSTGQVILSGNIFANKPIHVSHLANGVYFYRITTQNHQAESGMFIKHKD